MDLGNKPINFLPAQDIREVEFHYGREEGITLLEYYAGLAMQGFLCSASTNKPDDLAKCQLILLKLLSPNWKGGRNERPQ